MSNIKERVIQFIENKKIKKGEFFDKIGMTSANFRGDAKNTPLNSTAIENIISIFPEINLRWLMTGVGEMEKEYYHDDSNFKIAMGLNKTHNNEINYLEIIINQNELIYFQRKRIHELENILNEKESH